MAVNMRVRTVLTYGTGGPGLHTVYFRPGTTGGVTADASDAVARVRAFWDSIKTWFPSTFNAAPSSDVALIEDSTGALVGGLGATPVSTVQGTAAGAVGPLPNAALAQLRTGLVVNGRALRGRWFLGPISVTGQSSTGGFSATGQAAIASAGNAMIPAGPTTSFPVVWHRPGTGTGASAAITSVGCWGSIAVLRSRRDG